MLKATIIREKGTNGERRVAYALYLAGSEVKDAMMTDLITNREALEEVSMIVFCGGFSNSDVFGLIKGWAGALFYSPKAKQVLNHFYTRKDTLSLGICNDCQLMVESNLINPEYKHRARLYHNTSKRSESLFSDLTISWNNSTIFGSLSGNKSGVWAAHDKDRFYLPEAGGEYNITAKYNYAKYPGNPNGSNYNVTGICSAGGCHPIMTPRLERAIFLWR